jgi:hypothetical protein
MSITISAEIYALAAQLGIDVRGIAQSAVEREVAAAKRREPADVRHGSAGASIRALRDDERY